MRLLKLACVPFFCVCVAAAQQGYSTPAATLLQSAGSADTKNPYGVTVLTDDVEMTLDASNRTTMRYHMVYRVDSAEGVEGWASAGVRWEPWYQKKPTIRARVVTPDGVEHELDAKTLTDAATSDQRQDTYQNERILSGPLPAVQIGSVVEEEDLLEDTQPFFPSGIVRRFWFGRRVPVQHRRVTIEYPASLPLKYRIVSGQGISATKKEDAGKIHLVITQDSLPVFDEQQDNLPSDVTSIPYVVVSTAASWGAVANAYDDIVEKQIAAADLKAVVEKQKGADRMETIANLLAYVHANVRYTGVEFDQATLVPRTPAETFQRKFGDCKDKAAALVALLRASGIPANMALLDAGPGLDVDADEPGMGSFDHAIVYVPGTPDLWIDATAEYHKVGSLPYMDQGRMALVIRQKTEVLHKTAEVKSADNLLVEDREFTLAPNGKAKVRETSEAVGDIDAGYRSSYGAAESKQDRESMDRYVQNEYLGEALTKYEHTDGADLRKPFRLTLEVAHANRGFTDPDSAVVAIRYETLFSRFPAYLKQAPDGDTERKDSIVEARKPRVADVVFEPFVTEWRYHVVLPPGFRVRALPAAKTQSVGPAELSYSFAEEKDGNVTGVLRLDSVKGRYTVAEADMVRKAYKELTTGDPLLLTFDEVGAAELAAGHVKEGLAAERRLAAQYPTDAAVRTHLARALVAAGLGDLAREEATKATKLDPNSAIAYQALAWILQHDVIGRRLKKGFDYAGAVKAYRRAIELEQDNSETRANLAILLEYDTDGERYSPNAKLDDAIAEFRALAKRDVKNEHQYDDNVLIDLLYAGHLKEARDMAASLQQTAARLAVELAAIAALDGAPAAIEQAKALARNADNRLPALKTAGFTLRNMRMYAPAADLLASSAEGDTSAPQILAQVQLLRNTRKYEEVIDRSKPESAVQRLFLAFADPSFLTQEMADNEMQFVNSDVEKSRRLEALIRSGGAFRSLFAGSGIPKSVVVDLVISNLKPALEGDDARGYRIRVQSAAGTPVTVFVAHSSSGYKIVGINSEVTGVAVEALRQLDGSDVAGAKRWMDWVREQITAAGGDDPIPALAFPHLYTRGEAPDAGRLRRAALSLVADYKDYSSTHVDEIQRLASQATGADGLPMQAVLAWALRANAKWGELQTVAALLFAEYPQSDFAFDQLTEAVMHTRDWKTWDAAIAKRLERLPDDAVAVRSRSRLLECERKFTEARAALKPLIDSGRATASDMNGYGWTALFTGKVDVSDLDVVQRASSMTQNNNYAIVHTLACLYAEVGKTKEARDLVLHVIDVGGLDQPDSEVWYVLGRIAEQYGETEAALHAYAHVEALPDDQYFPTTTWNLAQSHLKSLDAASAKVSAAQ